MEIVNKLLQAYGLRAQPEPAENKMIGVRVCPSCGREDMVDHKPDCLETCASTQCKEFIYDYYNL